MLKKYEMCDNKGYVESRDVGFLLRLQYKYLRKIECTEKIGNELKLVNKHVVQETPVCSL